MGRMTGRDGTPAINLVTGEGCDELREAVERALQNPGQPATAGNVTVTCYDDGKRHIEFRGEPDPSGTPVWDQTARP